MKIAKEHYKTAAYSFYCKKKIVFASLSDSAIFLIKKPTYSQVDFSTLTVGVQTVLFE